MHYNNDVSGGGGGDGDAIGTGVQQEMAVAGQQSFVTVAHGSGGEGSDDNDWNSVVARQQQLDLRHNGGVVETSGAPGGSSGGDGEDGSGPLSGTVFGGDGGAVYGGPFALQLVCYITPNPSSQMLSAISTLFANRRPGSTIFLGYTDAVIHGVSSGDCVYNQRQPRPWERYLMLGDGKCMPVGFYGGLDLNLRCEQDVRVALTNVAVVPGLAFNVMFFNRMQERHEIILNRAEASMLGGRVRFKKFRAGNFIQATRVPHDDARPQPPAIVAAMMRPGPPSSMYVNDFHNSLRHVNVKALYETAKQMGIKLTGIQEYCDSCATAKAIKRTVPKVVNSSRKSSGPFQRIFIDLAGGYPKSTGGAKYLIQLLDDYTNFGWTVFLGDKSSPTVVRAFRTWYGSVKQLMGVHGEVRCVLTDNGTEWVNEDFRTMLVDLGIARELTAVDGPKRNSRVERRIALVSEGTKAAFVEFPDQFSDITFPARTKSYAVIWPEAFTWMDNCLNITAAVHKDDKRCAEEKLYGKRRVKQAWPFMMPGFCHRNRPTKVHDKGEQCFYLHSGNDHSFDTYKVITPAGIATYSAHYTFGYRRQAFQGEVPIWGGGCYYLFAAVAVYGIFTKSGTGSVGSGDIFTRRGYSRRDTGGGSSSTWGGHSSHVFIGSGGGGGGILDIFARGRHSSRVFIGTGTGGVGSFTWGGHSSHVFIGSGGYVGGCGDIFPWGVFPPRFQRRR